MTPNPANLRLKLVGGEAASAAVAPLPAGWRVASPSRRLSAKPGVHLQTVRPADDDEGHIERVEKVTGETAAAASMSALDPRWALAVRTAKMLEGGRAAILTPDKRQEVVELAKDLGLRPFDAHLVIAIVQDSARVGADPLGTVARQRLKLVRGAPVPQRDIQWVGSLIAAGCLGLMGAWMLIRAVLG